MSHFPSQTERASAAFRLNKRANVPKLGNATSCRSHEEIPTIRRCGVLERTAFLAATPSNVCGVRLGQTEPGVHRLGRDVRLPCGGGHLNGPVERSWP